MDKRAFGIAFLARRYRLLSERPEYLAGTHGELVERLLASDLGQLDRTLILHTSKVDQLCGQLVAVLCASRNQPASLLDAFETLEPDNIIAVHWALPELRRERLRKNPVWRFHLEHEPPGVEDAIFKVVTLAEETQQAVIKMAALTAGASKADRAMTKRHERTALTMTGLFPHGRR
jgi:hypothetical protein